MTNTALITGASAGIGEELARVHAEKGGHLILVARRKDRLESIATQLRAEHGVQVQVIAADLAKPGAAKKLMADVDALGTQVDVLINNAGFGGHGKFHESGLERDQRMMQLNMVALTELAYYFAQGMVERGAGKILNVGSTAGFLPGPLQAVYYASKAYVNSFSQAIANELEGTGVTVTVLCPGPVATEFQEAGDLAGVKGFDLAA
ncbi:MAG: short-subunit dehydrogenase, partial [Glaciecola sp.]